MTKREELVQHLADAIDVVVAGEDEYIIKVAEAAIAAVFKKLEVTDEAVKAWSVAVHGEIDGAWIDHWAFAIIRDGIRAALNKLKAQYENA